MKIALLIPTLNGGGAERVMSTMANYWASHGHEVLLVTHDRSENDFYPLDSRVVRHGFDISKPPGSPLDTVKHNIQRITLPRRCMVDVRPDAVISFTVRMNVQNLIALRGTGIPVIVSERNNPLAQQQPLPFTLLRRYLYPKSSALVVQTEAARMWALGFMPHEKVHVIPNPVSMQQESLKQTIMACSTGQIIPGKGFDLHGCRHLITAAGRFTHQKGFDLLIEAFSRATRDTNDWCLMILGEGEDRSFMQDLISRLSLQDRVFLPGMIQNLEPVLKKSTFFVLSSRYEGFPNVLLEAMAMSLPVISTDCPFGPSEIVNNGVDGILVPNGNVRALAGAMEHLMVHEDARRMLGEHARVSSERFSLDTVMHQWEALLETITSPSRGSSRR